jgi:hypothetical protein
MDEVKFCCDAKLFMLSIHNYEFLDADNASDRNWLMIHVFCKEPAGRWSFNQAFLMTSDLPRWAEWFTSVTNQSPPYDVLCDYDGVLWFEYHGMNDGLFDLTASFYQEGRPPWAVVNNERLYTVDFHIPAEQLHEAAAVFRSYIERFPPREVHTIR